MFNFTTTNFVTATSQVVANPNGSVNTLWVEGPGLLKQDNIVAIYRNPYLNPVDGKLVIDPAKVYALAATALGVADASKVPATTLFRLNFYIRRSGDVNSYYANDFVFKGKDFHYEWKGTKDAAGIAKQIVKINKLYGDIYLTVGSEAESVVSADTAETASTKLVVENDNYGLFTDVVVEMWQPANSDCCSYREGEWVELAKLDHDSEVCTRSGAGEVNCSKDVTGATKDDLLVAHDADTDDASCIWTLMCVNGSGTYEQLMHDLRLPTMENTNWTSLTQAMGEMPVPGTKYVQYTIHMVACRDILGGSAVGEVTHSKTTHVLFVPAECSASGLDAAVKKAIEDANMGKLLVDVTSSKDKTDPVTSPEQTTKPVHEELTGTRTNKDTAGE